MIDPVIFANINSFSGPPFVHQRNEGEIASQTANIDVLDHHNSTGHEKLSESSRLCAYASRGSALVEERPQLTAVYPTSVESYKPDGKLNQNMEEIAKPNDTTCTDCGKTFSERSFLLRHRIAHAEAKYICHICSRAFVRDDKLKRHVRCVHSHERPFVCEICTKAFARKDKLQEHARHHNRDITFTCPVCSDVFVMRSHLNRHLRSSHQIKQASGCSSSAGVSHSTTIVGEGQGSVRMKTDSGSLDSGSAVDPMSPFPRDGLTREKMKSTRPKPAVKRARKKTTESGLPVVGKPFSLSGSPQLSAFSVPTPLMFGSGATVHSTENPLTSNDCLSAAPMLHLPHPVQPHPLTTQYHYQQQQAAMQMRQQQQDQAYNINSEAQGSYFAHQNQHLHHQQQHHQHNQPSAFSAAMAASLFSPVNYVSWWPQANPSLVLHQSQQPSPYSHLTGTGSGNNQQVPQIPDAAFLAGSNSSVIYTGNHPEGMQQQRVNNLVSRPILPNQGLTATTLGASAGGTTQYAVQDSDLVRPDAAAAAQVFASLPPLAQAVYYQAATLAATQNSASNATPPISAAYNISSFDQNTSNQFTVNPSGAFQLPTNGPITN